MFVARFAGEMMWRSLLVVFLIIAAGLYNVFALRAGESASWLLRPGSSFPPPAHTIACLSFDLFVAAYVAAADTFGPRRDRGPTLRHHARYR